MQELSEFKQKALLKAQQFTEKNAQNTLYVKWREECIESNGFFDGTNQWPVPIVQELRRRGQDIVVLNKILPIVNQICGYEVNTRTKIAYRTYSGKDNTELLAKAVTHWGFAIQGIENYSYKGSLRCEDTLVGGLGWIRNYYYKKRIYYDYINSLNVIFDADDFSPQLEDMESVQHMWFLSLEQKKAYWPKFAKIFEEMDSSSGNYSGGFSAELSNRQSSWVFPLSDSIGGRTPIIECQYRVPKKYYCGVDKNGYYFEAFDEQKAEHFAENKNEIDEEVGTQIIRTLFYRDLLLDHSPLYPNIPNCKDFSLIPLVWRRRKTDSIPVGIVEPLKDLQREINYRKAKELHALNSKSVVMDITALPPGTSVEDFRSEATRPDALYLKTPGSDFTVIPNIDMAASHLRAQERNDKELQQISGMYSDFMGEPTNAQSGVAIKQRQIGSAKNFTSGFDAFGYVKNREGKMLLNLMQSGDFENMEIQFLDEDELGAITLNLVREIDGEKVVFNDVRTIPLDIYPERVPDYDSSPEELQSVIQELLANPAAAYLLQNEELLKLVLRYRHVDKIANAMKQINQEQMAMKQGANTSSMPPQTQDTVSPLSTGSM